MNGMQEGQAFARAASDGEASELTTDETSNAAASEAGSVDKIREILFGGHMRDYDRRFARLEERLIRESTELREENRKAVEALETFVKKEIEALIGRLQNEQQSREGSVQNVTRELHETSKTLESRLAQFDNQTTAAHRDLREQILDQSKTLNEEMRRRYEDISTLLQREVSDLTNQKTDRAALSSLFTELAMRLNQDINMPGDN
jgi:phosphoenolpyruvate-protein kinase (PTS system EI component)